MGVVSMESLPETAGTLEWAQTYARMGWPIIPLVGKVPAVRDWQRFEPTAVNRRYWFGTRRSNVGLRTGVSGYVVVDTDTPAAEAWVRDHLPETPMRARSGGGSVHRYYRSPADREIRNRQGWNGIHGLDVRGHGGYVVLPGSVHPETGCAYEWLTDIRLADGLPEFSPAWVAERRAAVRASVARALAPEDLVTRARRYLRAIEPAVSGRGGHTKTFTTALKLARLVGYDPNLLWVLLCEYNGRCQPPWSEPELRHKWEEALRERR
jgi:Bifunctional DNA primase/polymerase, N-terminal